MRKSFALLSALSAALFAAPASAEQWLWGIQAEQLEWRSGEGSEAYAWDADAFVGRDEFKFVLRSEAEYAASPDKFETLENQLRLQVPVSDFFDAVAGVRYDSPDEGPRRTYGVLGLHGLAKQWFEVDADLYLSEYPAARFEVEYEGLITNRIIFTPSIELDIPLADDEATGRAAFGPKLELGGRLSYDLLDRAVAPYIGVHWERTLGESGRLVRSEGEDDDVVSFVVGMRLMF
ncbi:MAG: copper resistance protein B [Nisaea sp.]|uniref:copper resistance protein B n=1 Tax=Nisaea sp. TaxID=2024842 RepID=UPI001B264D2B|nr:copper resistance protein B [Nisaea sp.]MBO6561854.1 copper resistance protein B [Nisaea sp.]